MSWWHSFQSRPFWLRWPGKTLLFSCVLFAVLYPNPRLFWRHLTHVRNADALPDPHDPALEPVVAELEELLKAQEVSPDDPARLFEAVQNFVYDRVPYAWDWETWGVADYLPTVAEVLRQGREDCDGRAVLAAALLRRLGFEAQLAGDPRHIWVETPEGATMNPLGPPAFTADGEEFNVAWGRLLNPGPLAFGIAVFPWQRELILMATFWLLILPRSAPPGVAAVVFGLLSGTLVLLRLAGADPMAPDYRLIALAGLSFLAAIVLAIRWRPAPT